MKQLTFGGLSGSSWAALWLQAATTHYEATHLWWVIRRQLGCITSRVQQQFSVIFLFYHRWFKPLPRVPTLFLFMAAVSETQVSHSGEGASTSFRFKWISLCARNKVTLHCCWISVITSLLLFWFGVWSSMNRDGKDSKAGFGSLTVCAKGSTGATYMRLLQVAGLSAHDRSLHHGSLYRKMFVSWKKLFSIVVLDSFRNLGQYNRQFDVHVCCIVVVALHVHFLN